MPRSRPLALLVSLLLAYATLLAMPRADAATHEPRAAAAKKPRLTATKPKAVDAGAKARSKITLKNTTRKDLKKVTIIAKVSGTATATPRVKKIKKIKKGHKASFRLKFVTGNERAVKVMLVAKAGDKKVATTRFKLRTKPGTSTPAASLGGRYFLHKGINSDLDRYLYFGGGFVNEDVAEEGYVSCSAASEDCQPYTYDAGSGALTVGAEQGQVKISGSGLTLGGDFFQEAALQKAGTRYAVTLNSSYLSSLCPLVGCYYALYYLTLGGDGTYSETVETGLGYVSKTGTYEVISESRIRMRYVDDEGQDVEEIQAIGAILDEAGQSNPAVDGLVIAGNWFSPDD